MTIGMEGAKFTLDGTMVHLAGVDAYTTYEHMLNGKDITPIINRAADMFDETASSPFLRVARTFFSYNGNPGLGRLIPGQHPHYYTRIPEYLDRWGERGFAVLGEALNDTASWCPDFSKQNEIWQRIGEQFQQRPNRLLQLGNETNYSQFQHLDTYRFAPIPGVLCSKGSKTSGEYPDMPHWAFSDYHPRRDGIKGQAACGRYLCFVVGGDNEASPVWPGTYSTTLITEWIRIGDNPIPNYQTNDMGQCYRAGVDAAAWGAGIVAHIYNAMFTRVMSDTEFGCGRAMLVGMSKIDPVFRFGA